MAADVNDKKQSAPFKLDWHISLPFKALRSATVRVMEISKLSKEETVPPDNASV